MKVKPVIQKMTLTLQIIFYPRGQLYHRQIVYGYEKIRKITQFGIKYCLDAQGSLAPTLVRL